MNRHTHTRLGACRQQSCSLGLRESLGLPDLHSNRKQTATERTKTSLRLFHIAFFFFFFLSVFVSLSCLAHNLDIVKVKKLRRFPLPGNHHVAKRNLRFAEVQRSGNGNDPARRHGFACIGTWCRSFKMRVLK